MTQSASVRGPAPRRARWTLLVVSALLSVVLLAATISSWSGARALQDTVVAGQAALIAAALRGELTKSTGPPRPEAIAAFIEAHADLGVHALAVATPAGEVTVLGGRFSRDPALIPKGAEPLYVDGRVRVAMPLPHLAPPDDGPPGGPLGGPFGGPLGGPLGGPPGLPLDGPRGAGSHRPPPHGEMLGPPGGPGLGKRPPPPGQLPRLVVEFEPVQSAGLRARAQRDLGIGIVGAAALLLIAAVTWGAMRRAETAEARLTEKRHLESLGEMSAVLAHELRNPLASLKGHAQLLAEQLPEGRPQRKAERVVSETIRLQEIIESLLSFVRSGKIAPTETDPTALARRVVARFDTRAARVDVEAAAAPERWPLDADRVEQVLVNLVDNALDASPADAAVTLSVVHDAGTLRFTVSDRGDGVPEAIREHLFAPFRSSGKARGVGLGLAVAKRLVEGHGGQITMRDREGGGAQFMVSFPKGLA